MDPDFYPSCCTTPTPQKEQVGEATVEGADGGLETVEVLLRPYLDPEAGGLSWRPLEAEHGMRCVRGCWCLIIEPINRHHTTNTHTPP